MAHQWLPSKEGVSLDGRYYLEAFGFPDASLLEVHFRVAPMEYWPKGADGKPVPVYFETPTSYYLDLNGDGLQEHWFADYGMNGNCDDMGHHIWNPISLTYELVNPHSGRAPHNGIPRES